MLTEEVLSSSAEGLKCILISTLGQGSPTFLAPRASFMEDTFFQRWRATVLGGWFRQSYEPWRAMVSSRWSFLACHHLLPAMWPGFLTACGPVQVLGPGTGTPIPVGLDHNEGHKLKPHFCSEIASLILLKMFISSNSQNFLFLPYCLQILGTIRKLSHTYEGFLGGSVIKNPPAVQELQEMQVRSLGQHDPLEEGTATHSSILARRIPWTEELGGLQSTGSQRVGHDWATSYSLSLSIQYRSINFI